MTIEEGKGAGLHWSTLSDRSEPNDPMTMGVVWGMLVIDMIVYLIIMWYIDGVKPGKYGVAKKWYFPFQVEKSVHESLEICSCIFASSRKATGAEMILPRGKASVEEAMKSR